MTTSTQAPTLAFRDSLRRSPRLFKIARTGAYAARSLYGRTAGRVLRPVQVERYVKQHPVRKLHLGCGSLMLPGWLNTDAFPRHPSVTFLDATSRYPLPGDTFDFVYSEHMIEHIPFASAQVMASEAYRVLRPGGIMRVATPDLERILALGSQDLDGLRRRYMTETVARIMPNAISQNFCFYLNIFVREWGHVFIYDRATLSALLERAGFTDIAACGVGESRFAALRGVEHHGREIGEDFNRIETMVLEARKP
jgi:predicted SAM-dependent methyltransferase